MWYVKKVTMDGLGDYDRCFILTMWYVKLSGFLAFVTGCNIVLY